MRELNIVPCKGCGLKVPYTDLKPSKTSSVWVCPNCINKEIKKKETVKKSEIIPTRASQPSSSASSRESSYKCERCDHKIRTIKKVSSDLMCPFCGEKGTLRLQKTSAEILKEVESIWEE